MKMPKILNHFFKFNNAISSIRKTATPIVYDRNNVTREEYRQYVKYLAENNINKTFYEPDCFVTLKESELRQQREKEIQEYKNFVHFLSKNNINRTFWH